MNTEDLKIRSEETRRDSWEAKASEMSSELSAQVSDIRPIFQLYLISKKVPKYKRPLIISTKFERLSFYNTYTIPAWKTEPISKEIVHHNSLIWLHIGNFMFKSLSHTFVHIFYASYSPEEHIFPTKMVPFCVGHKFLVLVASLAALVVSMNSLYLTFYYFINGFLNKNPWNRCRNSTYYDVKFNIIINCLELDDFIRQSVNMTFDRSKHLFMNSNHDYLSLAQYEYLRYIFEQDYSFGNMSLVYFAVLWAVTALLTLYVSKNFFWKVLHYAHWSIILTNILTVLYILLILSGFKGKRDSVTHTSHTINYKYWLTDLNIIEGITTAPPFAHILSSRSTQSIEPSSDSTVIIISNATYYLFRIYLSGKMSTFCKSVIGIALDDFPYRYVFFLIWPIFYMHFYLGDLYSLIFFGLNFVAALLSSSVTFRCLIEMVIYEWREKIKLEVWMVISVVYLTVILLIILFNQQVLGFLCLYTIGFATLSEIIILYIFYPLGRLIDDYTFHYGVPPTRLRKLSLQVVPFYYMIKFFALLYSLYDMRNSTKFIASQYLWCWYLTLVPLVLGMIYKIFKQHVTRKASISQLFSPDPQWGPKEFSVRNLRKQYDSRVYVKSDVPRSLSRHLLSQAEPKVYKLDVHYDVYNKHHVESSGVRFRVEKENKD